MELFVGTDIVEVERIKKAFDANSKFLERLFTQKEIEYFNSKRMKLPHIAGFFSAKESISKVLGTGISGFSWKDIEICHDEKGAPAVILKGKAKNIADKKGIRDIKLSISHTKTYAISCAIAIGGEKNDSADLKTDERS
ncbi:MAG: Holo-[acyl-carrier-protein] synthase [Caldanaerobacter subterraneus]|jgi:holo-[acyl-carrier protein] synthase|uniref:Holo-[acyl-carrier-protein] synthase n=3 Tax=Thermoanaerobacter TaxID=1754 RepID=ACPS_THEP3|nr:MULTISPECIES: holo-ACP synthase [Thermoanaerobacter]B0K5Y6.1 RecName: Full=Holo-[acyl-carrier-protein] synthase; Short=Holo-ACP synthase; AltName: Full=4'-phosphopantetheinyl transferase AcpS [Thermoanaerobacter sp. X514]B0KD52.1 RecName: Full=Holo-[acyl-carrier-protein] synthase; Short=Holo-ACP synthase; AltName: Full=4'-phosphopantetheinyl transferase AcpS [Thermoanaerobacter pseudethanolicus ATCC 33223]KUJ91732.1 MAG: holo-acyl-carrier-protein synthase [Thermoanaerobacter thermocopriae]KU